jgi:hypothetical protein
MLGSKKPTIQITLLLALLNFPPNFAPAEMVSAPSIHRPAGEAEVETAFKLFAGKSLVAFFSYLDEVRPRTSAAAAKRRHEMLTWAVAQATANGQMTADQIRAYQQRLNPVFRLHRRENTLALVVFRSDEPYVMNHANALITVSSRSVELAGSEAGLAGLVAHEVAHDYLTSSQVINRLDTDERRGREIELVCDGIAVATLLRLGLDPAAYADALSNNILSSAELARLNRSDMLHPPLPSRLKMIRLVSAQFGVMAAGPEKPRELGK